MKTRVIIQEYTTKNPITMIGQEAGICYGKDVNNLNDAYKRGIDCIDSMHGRTWEFPTIYMIIEGYSARCIREFYTHIGGAPTRLQESTRYIDYTSFDFITPETILNNEEAYQIYLDEMKNISSSIQTLTEKLSIPKEDAANLLPIGMRTKIVAKFNPRTMSDMSHQRLCYRAYWEMRDLMKNIMTSLSEYSDEWKTLVEKTFKPKCVYLGYCPEKNSCNYFDNLKKM